MRPEVLRVTVWLQGLGIPPENVGLVALFAVGAAGEESTLFQARASFEVLSSVALRALATPPRSASCASDASTAPWLWFDPGGSSPCWSKTLINTLQRVPISMVVGALAANRSVLFVSWGTQDRHT